MNPRIEIVGLALFAVPFAVPFAHPAFAADPPPGLKVEVSTLNGSGCPPGSVTVGTGAGTGFTIRYSLFTARIGGDALPTDFRKNCQVGLRVTVPQDFSYAVSAFDLRGFAQLEPGTTATLRSAFYYAGTPSSGNFPHTFQGPFSDTWQFTDTVDPDRLIWVPCGEARQLDLNTELRLTPDKTKPGVVTMDSDLDSAYHFTWRSCS